MPRQRRARLEAAAARCATAPEVPARAACSLAAVAREPTLPAQAAAPRSPVASSRVPSRAQLSAVPCRVPSRAWSCSSRHCQARPLPVVQEVLGGTGGQRSAAPSLSPWPSLHGRRRRASRAPRDPWHRAPRPPCRLLPSEPSGRPCPQRSSRPAACAFRRWRQIPARTDGPDWPTAARHCQRQRGRHPAAPSGCRAGCLRRTSRSPTGGQGRTRRAGFATGGSWPSCPVVAASSSPAVLRCSWLERKFDPSVIAAYL